MMADSSIASRIAIRRRYVRSVDLARDAGDPDALDGYVVTPSVRDATIRLVAGLSSDSRQRAFRVVGPYGAGKSAFGVFVAQLFQESGDGPASKLFVEAAGRSASAEAWTPVILTGRRVSFARELLRAVVIDGDGEADANADALAAEAQSLIERPGPLDAHSVAELVSAIAAARRARTESGLLLLIDEMGRFVEYAAAGIESEDPSIFQLLAERSSGRASPDLAVVGFMHHRFADYVSGMGGWIEAEWTRSAERYEELSLGASTEQSLFLLARAIEAKGRRRPTVARRAERVYGEAVDRGLFAAPRDDVVGIAPNLYPLHPASVAAVALAIRRFGQNERSLFGFLQSLEPASLMRFAHATDHHADNWYRMPWVFDHVAATMSDGPGGDRSRRWSLAFDAVTGAANLPPEHQDALKVVALLGVLEPLPGLAADADTVAWCLDDQPSSMQPRLDDLAGLKLVYRRPHRGDYGLWSSASVDLLHWLKEARSMVRAPERLESIGALPVSSRPCVAHRHYHATGTLRTFEIRLWTGAEPGPRTADGLILVAPVYPGDQPSAILQEAATTVAGDALAVVCARRVVPQDLKWAHEIALWSWIRKNCEELRVDELARTEVDERIATAEAALTRATALLGSARTGRDDSWWAAGEPVAAMPPGGVSALLSNLCDRAYGRAPILKNELINRLKLSSAAASARMRLLGRMLGDAAKPDLGMDGAPPERTIYRSVLSQSGMHREVAPGLFAFAPPAADAPGNWRPAWDCIAELLEARESVTFARLLEELAAPPYGLRPHPALLLIGAFLLASRDQIALMERNSFQPDLTPAHFMRLAKSPRNFALQSLREGPDQRGIVEALASGLRVLGVCDPTVPAVSERLFTWYNALPPHALKTTTVSAIADRVREVLRRAAEPGPLFFADLPAACGSAGPDGRIDLHGYVAALGAALQELHDATPSLRARAIRCALHAFRAHDLNTLRAQLAADYRPHRPKLGDHRLRVFADRASNTEMPDDRWLDGVAGHLTGARPANWSDDTLAHFDSEIGLAAANLARWLALASTADAPDRRLRAVHVVSIDGREQVVVIRRDRPSPTLKARLDAVRRALGSEPHAAQVLGRLLAEYADDSDHDRAPASLLEVTES